MPTHPVPTGFDPTGLRYDRADTDDQPTPGVLPPGVYGYPVGGRGRTTPDTSPEPADAPAPVAVQRPFDLRAMREARARRGGA